MNTWYDIVSKQPERILCAAIKRIEPRKVLGKPYHDGTNDILNIEIGYRHHDIMQRFNSELIKSPYAQGFYTSKGRFVGRVEAMAIAYIAEQVPAKVAFWNIPKEEIELNIIGEIIPDSKESLKCRSKNEEYYENLGFKELFSEDLY